MKGVVHLEALRNVRVDLQRVMQRVGQPSFETHIKKHNKLYGGLF